LKSSQKIKYSLILIIIVFIPTVFLLNIGDPKLALYTHIIILGICCSSIYASILSIASEFGYNL